MKETELARILRDVIVELFRNNLVNQAAWQEDLEKLETFINGKSE